MVVLFFIPLIVFQVLEFRWLLESRISGAIKVYQDSQT